MDTPSPNDTGQLRPDERAFLVEALHQSREQLLQGIRSLSLEQWVFKPDSETWSIAECCDHIGAAENLFLKMIRRGLVEDRDRAAAIQGKEKMLRKAVPNRSVRVKVPVEIKPFGYVSSPAEFETHFCETRSKTIEYVISTEDPLHWRVTPHFMLGDFDGEQWLEIVVQHSLRHLAQIEEVKSGDGFPLP